MSKLLVVVDMQNDFIDGSLGSDEAKAIVNNVVEKIKARKEEGYEVVYTVDTHGEDYMETEEGKNLPVVHCVENTEGWNIEPSILGVAGSKPTVFDKDTFGSIGLAQSILIETYKGVNYDTIELVGLCTDVCVISNAIACKMGSPNSHIVVDASCCAGVTPHSHDVAIEAMKGVQVEILNEGAEPWRVIK